MTDSSKANIPGSVKTIGVILSERIYAGLIVDHKLSGKLLSYPEGPAPENTDDDDSLVEMHTEALVNAMCEVIVKAAKGSEDSLTSVGVALPGLIRAI